MSPPGTDPGAVFRAADNDISGDYIVGKEMVEEILSIVCVKD
jgi:hypothetical protein